MKKFQWETNVQLELKNDEINDFLLPLFAAVIQNEKKSCTMKCTVRGIFKSLGFDVLQNTFFSVVFGDIS